MSQTIADPRIPYSPQLLSPLSVDGLYEDVCVSPALFPLSPQGSPIAGPVSRDQTGPCLSSQLCTGRVCHCGHCSSSAPARLAEPGLGWLRAHSIASTSVPVVTGTAHQYHPACLPLPTSHITRVTQHPSCPHYPASLKTLILLFSVSDCEGNISEGMTV